MSLLGTQRVKKMYKCVGVCSKSIVMWKQNAAFNLVLFHSLTKHQGSCKRKIPSTQKSFYLQLLSNKLTDDFIIRVSARFQHHIALISVPEMKAEKATF